MKFKKISAIFASTLMTGLTIAGAAAASFPAPFVQNGVADVAIVYGTGAGVSPTDLTQAGNIQTTLAASMPKTGESKVDGEFFKFEKTSTKFHLGDNVTSVISATLNEDHLKTLLAEGVYVDNDNDEFDYTQKIVMGSNLQLGMFDNNDYKEDTPTVGFNIPQGETVLTYTLTMSEEPIISDLPSTSLTLMGKKYYVLSNSTSSGNVVLTLLDSAVDSVIAEGETITVVVDGVSHTVYAENIGSSTEAKLNIDGVSTNSLAELATQKVSENLYIGIKDIMYNGKDTGTSKVEFSLGKGKLELKSGSKVQMNEKSVNGLTATINTGTDTDHLASIALAWSAEDNLFITEDKSITMPGFSAVKLSYGGLTYPAEETIEIVQGGDTYATLNNFPLKNGKVDIHFLYGDSTSFTGLGKDDNERLVTDRDGNLTFDADTDAYFVASWSDGNDAESYLMKATDFEDDGTNNMTTFQYWDGTQFTDKKVKAKNGNTFSIGNVDLAVGAIDVSNEQVFLWNNSVGTNFYTLYSAEGLTVYLPVINDTTNLVGDINITNATQSTSFNLSMREEDKSEKKYSGDVINVTLGWDASTVKEVEVSTYSTTNTDAESRQIGETKVYRDFTYSDLATEILWDKPTSGQKSLKLIYHGDEVAADVYITAPETTVGGTGTLGNVLAKDSEVSNFQGKNLIIVGGSCINSAAAKALGVSEHTCGTAFTTATGVGAGQFLIKSVADAYTTGKIALVVAGYDVADTANAATYLRTKTVDTTVGKTYKGTTATTADLVVQ